MYSPVQSDIYKLNYVNKGFRMVDGIKIVCFWINQINRMDRRIAFSPVLADMHISSSVGRRLSVLSLAKALPCLFRNRKSTISCAFSISKELYLQTCFAGFYTLRGKRGK